METTFMYSPPDYYPAICLALNHEAGGLEIDNYMYDEDMDLWSVEITERDFGTSIFQLEGSFVRTCFKATKKGVTSWIK